MDHSKTIGEDFIGSDVDNSAWLLNDFILLFQNINAPDCEDKKAPYVEDMDLLFTPNPYSETKTMMERVLTDTAKENPEFAVSLLSYVNHVDETGVKDYNRVLEIAGEHVRAIENLDKGVHRYNIEQVKELQF